LDYFNHLPFLKVTGKVAFLICIIMYKVQSGTEFSGKICDRGEIP